MSIQREQIQIEGPRSGTTFTSFTSGTTITYFGTHLNLYTQAQVDNPDVYFTPTILEFNNLGEPVRMSGFDGKNIWAFNDDNYYIPVTSYTNNFITGYSFSEDVDYIVPESRVDVFKEKLSQTIELILNSGGTVVTSEGVEPAPNYPKPPHAEYVFATYHEIDDFYVNVKLERSFNILDTLSIYNNLLNSYPTQEADTGVVFGRLTALQNIKDTQGNPIKIPLRNVPIGIFNPSDDYPTSSSVSENGDRLYLNLKEIVEPDDYFNIESFSADTNNYLRSASQFTTVPDQYRYVTTTNENGEFVIYDAPVGTQIVVFEVDMFKQGLTKDEIALNFFPFPPANDLPIDNFPCFSFKQFTIDVVPAWGTLQTGYTELDITVNYDLRKWATYYIPPMAYDGNLLGSVELLNFAPSLNVEVRDMSKEGFPKTNIPIVEIQDILDKDEEQTLMWNSEFIQQKNSANFYTHGYKAFKVRANMYDPFGFRTNNNGIPRTAPTSQGVWLAGYQFKFYYNQPSSIFRATGYGRDWGFTTPGGWIGRDHFHLNRGALSDDANTSVAPLTTTPYDRPWDHLYPEPYSIPQIPTELNFTRNNYSTRITDTSNAAYLEQPLYRDGDLVGFPINNAAVTNDSQTGGYGVQYSSTNLFWPANRFSKEVTRKYIYKYESRVHWAERYSNMYQPSNPGFSVQPGISSVIGGEKFQRVECGYGYWLRPEGWPPVSFEPWGDTIFSQSTRPAVTLDATTFGPGVMPIGTSNGNIVSTHDNVFVDVYNIEDKDLALALDGDATFPEGSLDIYRIIDPNDKNEIEPDVIPTSALFRFKSIYFQRGSSDAKRIKTATKNSGGNDREECFSRAVGGIHGGNSYNLLLFEIRNNGNITIDVPGTSESLEPGQAQVFTAIDLGLDNLVMELPGNANYDFGLSKYTSANYTMRFLNIIHLKENGSSTWPGSQSLPHQVTIQNTNVPADSTPPEYHLITRFVNVRTQYDGNSDSCDTSGDFGGSAAKWEHSVKMDGALFKTPNNPGQEGDFYDCRFWDNAITPRCGASSHNDGMVAIPIEIT